MTAAAVLMCTATIASAQGGQGQGGPPPRGEGARMVRPGMGMEGPLFAGINLSDEQKGKIKAIHEKYREKNEEQRKAAMEAMQKARQSNDTAAMRTAMQQLSAIYTGEQEKEILEVLTPEQRERYNKNKEEMKTRMRERGGDRGGPLRVRQRGGAPPQRTQ
jgi:Spy/CpxP family protein refolding chaperone